MRVFIPSKDRASQLDLLLRSIEENLPNIEFDVCVLYKTSSEDFGRGYDILSKKKFKNIFFSLHKETNFQDQFKDYAYAFQDQNVMLLTDDSVFYRKSNLKENEIDDLLEDKNILCYQNRLGFNTTTQWYKTGQQQQNLDVLGFKYFGADYSDNDKPAFVQWNWKIRPPFENYGYFISWDGAIYRGEDLLDFTNLVNFYNPRTFEDRLTKDQNIRNNIKSKFMVCPEISCLFVNTINAVQAEPPPFGDKYQCSVEELNKRYLAGEIISMYTFRGLELSGSHDEIPLEFENGNI